MPSFACIVLKYDFVCVYSFDLCYLWCLLNRWHLYFQLKQPFTVRTCCLYSTKSMVHNSFKSGTSMGVDCELASPFHKRSRLKNVWCSKGTFWVCGDWMVPIIWEDFPVILQTMGLRIIKFVCEWTLLRFTTSFIWCSKWGLFMLHPRWNCWDIF